MTIFHHLPQQALVHFSLPGDSDHCAADLLRERLVVEQPRPGPSSVRNCCNDRAGEIQQVLPGLFAQITVMVHNGSLDSAHGFYLITI